jgi:probable HAF family extracellular repeat protein
MTAKWMNASGLIIGSTVTPQGLKHGFSWTETGGIKDLKSIGSGKVFGEYSKSEVLAVNARGQVVGVSNTNIDGIRHGSLWMDAGGVPMDLGTLFGPDSVANAVNDSGQVVGGGDTADFVNGNPVQHAFIWTQASGMLDLGTLPGGTSSTALAVNANGVVVGGSDTVIGATHATHAFFWTQADGIKDLGTVGSFPGSQATAANGGWVIGQSTDAAGQPTHAAAWVLQCR